ncbi:hypothetical protein DRO97_02400 [Archaeoglobales archaeon]|nr:MAG: hypothetical protein DRO97_02400 [Archaeoglobales archaeon]
MPDLTPKEAATLAVYCNLKEKGKLRKENKNLEKKAKEIINKYNLTDEQVKLIYDEFCNPNAKTQANLAEVVRAIDLVFDFLEKGDYGYTPERQDVEAHFWDRFLKYFKIVQLTEMNRILNQLSDIYEGRKKD